MNNDELIQRLEKAAESVRNAGAEIDSAYESMGFAAPETMNLHWNRIVQALNALKEELDD
jgi:AraC-like DNA-binding protein